MQALSPILAFGEGCGFQDFEGTGRKVGICLMKGKGIGAVHLDLSPASLNQEQFRFLCDKGLCYEICRAVRVTLDHPSSYKHIDLLYGNCYSFVAAATIGDVGLMRRLLLVPEMNPAARGNRAIRYAAIYGQL